MTKIKLSICIATYNRAEFIGETLDSIIPQLTDEIELLVVDGNSPDRTQSIVEQYSANCPQLRYVRLPTKGGVDQDYCKTVELAKGEYCWLFTDDDLLKENAVVRVIKTLDNNDLDLVIVNAEVRDVHLKELLEESRLTFKDDRSYDRNNFHNLLVDAGEYMSFIGCIVIKKSFWKHRDKATYFGTEFIHVGVICQSPLPKYAYIITETLVEIRYGNAQWKPRDFEIWMFKWPRLIWSFDGFDEKTKLAVVKAEPWRGFGALIGFRFKGSYTSSHYHEFLSDKNISIFAKFMSIIIAMMPVRVAFLLYVCGIALRRREIDKFILYDYNSALGLSK
jgi:abequosyltransferase